jgi:hypothetical protein
MIDPGSDDDLDALLGGGRLSGPARDRVFENVVSAVGREPRRRRLPRLALSLAAVAAGMAAVVVLAPHIRSRGEQSLRAKGGEGAVVRLDVECAGGTLESCPHGATLTFGASGGAVSGVLSAYAEPIDHEPGLERIWYFSAEGESPYLDLGGGTNVARRAVRIGSEHVPGRYRIHLFLTPAPVPKAVLLAGRVPGALGRRDLDLRITADVSPSESP